MGAFTNLLCAVRRTFLQPPKMKGKPTLIIPSFADLRDGSQTEKVQSQCREIARVLSTHLYKWERSFPHKSLLKTFDTQTLSFVGMDLDRLADYLVRNFILRPDDGCQWLADRIVVDRIMQACTGTDSPLPLANWQIETDRKRKAAR